MTSEPLVSIIICVYNRAQTIGDCLDSLLAMRSRDFEIVLVDDASTDETPQRLQEFQHDNPDVPITIVRNAQNRGVSGARNRGIDVARGKYIAFTDSDCTVAQHWISALMLGFLDPQVAAVSGTVIDPRPRNAAERAYFGATRVGQGRLQARPLVGNNMAFGGELLRHYRFDDAMTYGCDEDDLALRLQQHGYRFAFVPDAVVYHHHPMTLRGYLNLALRQGTGAARYWYKHNRWLGRDLWPAAAALASLPLAFLNLQLLAVSVFALLLQVVALVCNEKVFKGKSWSQAVATLPVNLLYYGARIWAVGCTYSRLVCGGEQAIRQSKLHWRRQITTPPRPLSGEIRRTAA